MNNQTSKLDMVNLHLPFHLFGNIYTPRRRNDDPVFVQHSCIIKVRGKTIKVRFSREIVHPPLCEGTAFMAAHAARQNGWRTVYVIPELYKGYTCEDGLAFVNEDFIKNVRRGSEHYQTTSAFPYVRISDVRQLQDVAAVNIRDFRNKNLKTYCHFDHEAAADERFALTP